MTNDNWQSYIAEFLGTFGFVLIGAGAVMAVEGGSDIGTVGIALAHGLGIAALIYGTGRFSGAHLNPAITVAFWSVGTVHSGKAVAYVVSQLFGGVMAAYILQSIFPTAAALGRVGAPSLQAGLSVPVGMAVEAIFTFFLAWTVLALSQAGAGAREHVGLAAGSVVAAAILVAGHATGAALNPARAFGPAFVAGAWADHSVWWVGPLAGAVLAALVWRFFFAAKTR